MREYENLEERLFSADIEALRAYDTGFDSMNQLWKK